MISDLIVSVDGWTIRVFDNGTNGRNKENPNKYNFRKDSRECLFHGCTNVIRANRTSGLCDNHIEHQHDLLLIVKDRDDNPVSLPRHKDIIDALMNWAASRNFSLDNFFSDLSFHVQGNIPDVSTLASVIKYPPGTVIMTLGTLRDIYDFLLPVIEKYFPENNSSSYQQLLDSGMSAIVLVNIFVGLLICEEANRGDRWFCRNHMKDESKTKQLGAAMPLAYYATRTFAWGIELNKTTAHKLTL